MKYTLFIAIILIGFSSRAIYGHELAAEKDVGALMHIEPNDEPKIGVSSTVWFDLVKKGGQKIGLAQCDCVFSLYKGSEKKPLVIPTLVTNKTEESKSVLSAEVTFPDKGVYRLVLSGKPKGQTKFTPFTLRWTVRASE